VREVYGKSFFGQIEIAVRGAILRVSDGFSGKFAHHVSRVFEEVPADTPRNDLRKDSFD
jgi:hypothetical protein